MLRNDPQRRFLASIGVLLSFAVVLPTATARGQDAPGSILAWGYSGFGQCNVPPPNADFVSVVAGTAHSLGLKTNGSIVA